MAACCETGGQALEKRASVCRTDARNALGWLSGNPQNRKPLTKECLANPEDCQRPVASGLLAVT